MEKFPSPRGINEGLSEEARLEEERRRKLEGEGSPSAEDLNNREAEEEAWITPGSEADKKIKEQNKHALEEAYKRGELGEDDFKVALEALAENPEEKESYRQIEEQEKELAPLFEELAKVWKELDIDPAEAAKVGAMAGLAGTFVSVIALLGAYAAGWNPGEQMNTAVFTGIMLESPIGTAVGATLSGIKGTFEGAIGTLKTLKERWSPKPEGPESA